MKIKHLTIRNIASIEKGDIDFENGLNDAATGEAASLFLITGDTGSGKSVILDCICMALYGTTPRLRGVSNPRGNTYHSGNDNEISVNDIKQYTRIGISHRDDCFAELEFTGNDGHDYTSRFSLGYTNRGSLRTPKWTLMRNGEMICENRTQAEDIIREAIGLTYNQFNRMAMLAQGQFANFLVGKKEEREEILEQLTATGKFSRYGEAISNIYRRTKEQRDLAASEKKMYDGLVKSEEILGALNEEFQANKELSDKELQGAQALATRITTTENYAKFKAEAARAEAELKGVEAIEASDGFITACSHIQLWDNTTEQRAALASRRKGLADKQRARKRLEACRAEFDALDSDLTARVEVLETRKKTLAAELQWIESCREQRAIFENVAVIMADIGNFNGNLSDRARKTDALTAAKGACASLSATLEKADAALREASDAVAAVQARIDKDTAARQALQPEKLSSDREAAHSRLNSLRDLSSKIEADTAARTATEELRAEINSLKDSETALAEDVGRAKADVERLSQELDMAKNRYTTMHLSVEENFSELRARLAADHATVCPLCRQGIDDHAKLLEDNNFDAILSPLKEEAERLAAALKAAQAVQTKAESDWNALNGAIKAKEANLEQLEKRDAAALTAINSLIKVLTVNPADLEQEIKSLESTLEVLTQKIDDAEAIQRRINADIATRKPLDDALAKAREAQKTASEAVATNQVKIAQAQAAIEELNRRISALREKINATLRKYLPNWESDTQGATDQLQRESDQYLSRVRKADEAKTELRLEGTTLDNMEQFRTALAALLAPYAATEPAPLGRLSLDMIGRRWKELDRTATAAHANLTTSAKEITEADRVLDAFYASSPDASEVVLAKLMDSEKEIAESRDEIRKLELRKKEAQILLSTAQKSIAEAFETLGIEKADDLPELDALRTAKSDLDEQISALAKRRGAIEAELKADADNRLKSQQVRDRYEAAAQRYECWNLLNSYLGGSRFRTLVQTHILHPLLDNANIYLSQITDHYILTCSEANEQLSIFVQDRYNRNELRSVTVLSGGERFMISLALSLALSAMNRPDMNVNILFIDEGFGTLDAQSLEQVMQTLRRLPLIAGQNGRRVGVISHREELAERIDTQIRLRRIGQGRSRIICPQAP